MVGSARTARHLYRLVLSDDARPAQHIEFEAEGVEQAMVLAERHGGGRQAELFEDGRLLGVLQGRSNGFWIVSSQPVGIGPG